jgi:hypothetical protein
MKLPLPFQIFFIYDFPFRFIFLLKVNDRTLPMSTIPNSESLYNVPVKYRKLENLHIVFWLLKDISWCMFWRPIGIAMVIPTIIVAFFIAWRTREIKSELIHNLAIIFWIIANSYWMISEFFHFENMPIYGRFEYKHLASIPFAIGLLLLIFYYVYWKPKHKDEVETM